MIKKILKWFLLAIAGFVVFSVLLVAIYKFINPPATPLMFIRVFEAVFDGKSVGIDKDWASYSEISPNLFRALMVAEDRGFLRHKGFDWKAIDRARKYNERKAGKKLRGASTISMQTAKNTFLWQGRNYIRKGLEAYFTVLIEAIWGKKRILEIYANVIEWGDGIYGAGAASLKYFGKPPSQLSKSEAALLAAVLPNPRFWSPAAPSKYIQSRAASIQSRINSMGLPKD